MRKTKIIISIICVLVSLAVNAQTKPTIRNKREAEARMTEAKALMKDYRFEEAIEAFEEYIESGFATDSLAAACRRMIATAEMGDEMLERVEEVTILDSAKVTKSEMLKVIRIAKDQGSIEMKGNEVAYTTGRGDKSIYSEKGDLWRSYSGADKERLAGGVNSASVENYPFELMDGVTLYFGSCREGGLGGYDIYMSRYNSETGEYAEPVNLGMPYNSTANDYMMVIDEFNSEGWFATDRRQKKDTVAIYKFRVTDSKQYLSPELDDEILINSAKLLRYRLGVSKAQKKDNVEQEESSSAMSRFYVNDTIIYESISQFMDEDARLLYEETLNMQVDLKLEQVILEGLKKEYKYTEVQEDKETLKKDILEMEVKMAEDEIRVKNNIKTIRQKELRHYDK